jgi:hypothetical protein
MPTSSQSLILQTTNGQLPPFFGRHVWRAEPPPGLEWSSSEYPMTTVQVRTNFTGSDNKRYKTGRKPQPLKRTGSAPELTCKVDFSTLPNLLKIRGLHGTVRYDSDDKYVSWRINSIGPFYNRVNLRGRYPLTGKTTPGTLRYFHADRKNDSMYARDETLFLEEDMHHPEFRKQVHFYDQEINFNNESHPDASSPLKDNVFMSVEVNGGKLRMIKTNMEKAGYFKLVQIQDPHYESEDFHGNRVPIFRLETCQPTEAGCFRLAPTEPREVGDFKLVPPQGYLADDFRLVPSPEVQGAFVLLQSETGNPGQYHPVLRNKDALEDFRFVQAKIQQRSNADINVPREAWGNSHTYIEQENRYRYYNMSKDKTNHGSASDHIYDYFDDVRDRYSPVENNNLPDISLYESNKGNVLHHQPTAAKKYGASSTFDNDLRTFNRHLDEFNQRYQDSMRRVSSQDSKRPVQLDVETPDNDKENSQGSVVEAGFSSKVLSSEWKTHNFDQWSRTTKNTLLEPLETPTAGVTR